MKEALIKEIVAQVFKKAKMECPKHSKYALSNYVAASTVLSSRTLERLYDKYLDEKNVVGEQNEHTVNVLCQYLDYESYADYVKQNTGLKKNLAFKKVGNKKNLKIGITLGLIALLGMVLVLERSMEPKCMVWKIDHYEKIDCAVSYKEKVVPLDEVRLRNFKKVKVDATTDFFDETTHVPLIWYYKTGNEMEYFTAPGLHPVNGKTLKVITEYMVDKTVPKHTYNANSFTE